MNPYDKAHELARTLKAAKEFQDLKQLKEKLDQDADAKRMVQDFRKRQWELESKVMSGQTISAEEQESLKKLQDVIQMHQLVREYLEAEYRFGVILTDIQRIIGEAVQEVVDSPF